MSAEFVDGLPPLGRAGRAEGFHGKPQQVFIDFANELRENPKQWAKYPKPLAASSAGSLAWSINNQGHRCPQVLRTGEFEAASRSGVLYVRFVGAS